MASVFDLVCPNCKIALIENTLCPSCGKKYPWLKEGKLISFQAQSDQFYQRCYEGIWKSKSETRLPFKRALMSIHERLSLSARRERFFRSHLDSKNNPLILDVACGGGRKLFKEYGRVMGLDIVLEPLYGASEIYDLCVHADAFSMPFPNDYFDYIVSSDFLGHVPLERKNDLYQEFRRVLKPNGKMVHVIETDANNWHFKFAHRYPDLFQKYFVEGIGGHFGLELPSKAVQRLEANGFRTLKAQKIWGELWQIEAYKSMFDNEYRQMSKTIAAIVILSKALSANVLVREATNIALNPVSALVERLTPLDNGQGLMVVCQKARERKMTDIPDLTVVIVNWNVKELLRDCLKSVYGRAQTISLEVLVVDNASSDGSIEMVEKEFPQVKLIANKENVGFAKANNQAIRESKGRYVMLLNPDTLIVGDALATMVLFMDNHRDTGAVGPKILNPDKTVQLTCGRYSPTLLTELWDFTKLSSVFPESIIFGKSLMSYWPHDDTREVELISGACMMVRRETIEQTGLMDEHFFLFAEETDWCYRIRKNGWKIYLNADAEIVHLSQQSVKRSSINTALESYKSMYRFFMKHHGLLPALGYRALVFIFIGLRIPVYWLWQYVRPSNRLQIQRALKQYPRILRWSVGLSG